jgi:hypothetical protein
MLLLVIAALVLLAINLVVEAIIATMARRRAQARGGTRSLPSIDAAEFPDAAPERHGGAPRGAPSRVLPGNLP